MSTIINRRRVIGEKLLPYDAEIEYLETDGHAYIDTGLLNSYNRIIEGKFYSPNDQKMIWGSGWDSKSFQYYIRKEANTNIKFRIGKEYIEVPRSNIRETHEFLFNIKESYAILDENRIDFSDQSSLPISANNRREILFKYLNFDIVDGWDTKRIYWTKYWEGDILLRDFIPVRVGTKGYMYDKVSGKLFGNSGTGDFILGPDKYYTEIEYLESNGTQWIDTNVACSTSNIIRATMQANGPQKNNNAYVFFGQGISYTDSNIELFSSMQLNKISGCIKGNSDVELDYTNLFNVELKDKIFTFTDSTGAILATANRSVAPNYTAANTMAIFALNRPSLYIRPNEVRCYKFSILNNGVYILDLIPVRVGQVGYMYDKVSGTLFGNAGTGDFILGPDKS